MSMDYNDYVNVAAYQAQTQRASAEAQADYQKALAAGASDQQALAWAQFRWKQKLDEAGQTGMWNGQWNNPQEQWFTSQFGQWYGAGGEPGVGSQTLQAQNQQFGQANTLSGMYGQYYAPGTTPIQGTTTQQALNQARTQAMNEANITGWYSPVANTNVDPGQFAKQDQATQQYWLQYNQNDPTAAANAWASATQTELQRQAAANPNANRQQTLAGNEQQFTQGLRTQQEARAAQGQVQNQTQAYLSLLASLRGPADYAKYQQVLGATPGGMRDLYAAAMGQYVPGGGATTGVQPQAVSLQSLQGDVSGNPYTGQGGGQLGQPNVYTGGQGAYQAQPYNYAAGGPGVGQAQTGYWNPASDQQNVAWGQPPGANEQWGSGLGVGKQSLTPAQQAQATGNGTNLPAPNQVAMQSWKNLAPSQQQLMLGQWEGQGWNKDDVQALMNQSLPKYANNRATAGTWRL